MTTTETLLRIEDLHTYFFTYEGVVKAVNGIDLSIGKGETLGLVGESGCGKSVTSLSIMQLTQKPQGRIVSGKIYLEGKNLLELSEKQMRDVRGNLVSMIYQEPMTSLNPVFTVGNQISEAIRRHRKVTKNRALKLAVDMLQKVGIPNPNKRMREYPHQLSGGMRQRAMIAMALSCNPTLLIADEPTTALDVTIQAQILDLMNKLKKNLGASILLITHDLAVIAEMAQSVAVMYAGRIIETAEVVEFFANPMHPYTLGLMDSIPKIDEVPPDRMLKAIPGIVPSLLHLPKGCSFQDRCSYAFDRCFKDSPPLFESGSGHRVRCWKYE
ncbi:peptide ABC transporter ATP-binding protein [Alkalispirochaeta odontotermitis]|nr:peptide ABC transporter ATP-binding protein [Alkalispirochaeta odontotermitis]CAB1083899.1 Oligopeptide ABC transporter, ATP-binding protein OppD (TC 3.A.1.5.1) [Olavius algarvensis Delta 1 endosymbiont]